MSILWSKTLKQIWCSLLFAVTNAGKLRESCTLSIAKSVLNTVKLRVLTRITNLKMGFWVVLIYEMCFKTRQGSILFFGISHFVSVIIESPAYSPCHNFSPFFSEIQKWSYIFPPFGGNMNFFVTFFLNLCIHLKCTSRTLKVWLLIKTCF